MRSSVGRGIASTDLGTLWDASAAKEVTSGPAKETMIETAMLVQMILDNPIDCLLLGSIS
jgi:hypothetical protein